MFYREQMFLQMQICLKPCSGCPSGWPASNSALNRDDTKEENFCIQQGQCDCWHIVSSQFGLRRFG